MTHPKLTLILLALGALPCWGQEFPEDYVLRDPGQRGAHTSYCMPMKQFYSVDSVTSNIAWSEDATVCYSGCTWRSGGWSNAEKVDFLLDAVKRLHERVKVLEARPYIDLNGPPAPDNTLPFEWGGGTISLTPYTIGTVCCVDHGGAPCPGFGPVTPTTPRAGEKEER